MFIFRSEEFLVSPFLGGRGVPPLKQNRRAINAIDAVASTNINCSQLFDKRHQSEEVPFWRKSMWGDQKKIMPSGYNFQIYVISFRTTGNSRTEI